LCSSVEFVEVSLAVDQERASVFVFPAFKCDSQVL
jgi:hypothetical protein